MRTTKNTKNTKNTKIKLAAAISHAILSYCHK